MDIDKRVLWRDASFVIKGGEKVAIIGNNGVGKTTLIKQVLAKEPEVIILPAAKIGYFSQNVDILNTNKNIEIAQHSVIEFKGSYEEYRQRKRQSEPDFINIELLKVETKLTEIISKLSEHPSEILEHEFQMLIAKRNHLRNQVE